MHAKYEGNQIADCDAWSTCQFFECRAGYPVTQKFFPSSRPRFPVFAAVARPVPVTIAAHSIMLQGCDTGIKVASASGENLKLEDDFFEGEKNEHPPNMTLSGFRGISKEPFLKRKTRILVVKARALRGLPIGSSPSCTSHASFSNSKNGPKTHSASLA